jgi:hypothetical protein
MSVWLVCNNPVPDMAGDGHPACSKPAGHELPHANDEGLVWDSRYVGWPTAPRK